MNAVLLLGWLVLIVAGYQLGKFILGKLDLL